MSKKSDEASITSSILSGLADIPFYPLHLSKVLIQIGHEPLPAFKSKNIFGKEFLYYPNTFKYTSYVFSVEGLSGIYRGLGMKIISSAVSSFVYDKTINLIEDSEAQIEEANNANKTDQNENGVRALVKTTSKKITARCWAVIISHPFHVMSLRCVAQFIGGETQYSSWNIFQNAMEIYRCEGIKGFFNGLIPRILFETSTIALATGISYLIRTYLVHNNEFEKATNMVATLVTNHITYPMALVGTISCVSGSSLIGVQPPKMKLYVSWIEVFKHLYETNELKRGSANFFRLCNTQFSSVDGFKLNTSSNLKIE